MAIIIDFSKHLEKKKQKETVVLQFLIGYFKDLNDTGTVNIPYFIEARNKYKEIIKSNKDLNYYYELICNRNVSQM